MPQAKNGLAEWNTLNDEQRRYIDVFFMNFCSRGRCMDMNCRNSPFDILKCPRFINWRKAVQVEIAQEKAVRDEQERIMKNYLNEIWKESEIDWEE